MSSCSFSDALPVGRRLSSIDDVGRVGNFCSFMSNGSTDI